MEFEKTQGKLKPPASEIEIQAVQNQFKSQLPTTYLELLRAANGIEFDSGAILYASDELWERNSTYEVPLYAPEMIAIGDDGGGNLILIRQVLETPCTVYALDAGAIGAAPPHVLSSSLEEWARAGFPLTTANAKTTPEFADIYLVRIPDAGLKSLLGIKSELGLEMTISEIKKGAEKLPFLLLKRVPFGKYLKRAEKINTLFGNCVQVRDSS